MILSIVTDIEGTTTPVSFVHRVLFPYARARLEAFIATTPPSPALAGIAEPKLETLLGWMDRDEKITALKTIQGEIWARGYADGDLKAELYPDVTPALRRWARAGVRLFVYSSGSVAAQKLLFSHTPDGDLTPLFQAYFDTTIGPKRDATSYAAIARALGGTACETLFLSDVEAELDAAAASGLSTCQLLRAQDGTLPSSHHQTATDFNEVALKFGLPRA
ncbi:acireductone synthase [Acidocella sp.]|uniref:acireductone synthase n=1 Tax=Acidocella sp. TaxID=50710 RepID=UPI003CFD21DF